jgi:hypothetical protein
MYRLSSTVVLMVVLILLASGCGGKGPQTTYNPAKDRIESLANLPPETELPSGGVTPNLIPIIDAATLAAANLEAVNVKTAARAFYVEHPSSSVFSSDVLVPTYSSGTLKARYFLNTPGCSIVRVETTANGWKGMVFSISKQKWAEGSPNNDHPNDGDIP